MQTSFSQQEYLAARAKMAELRAKVSPNAQPPHAVNNEHNEEFESVSGAPSSTLNEVDHLVAGVSTMGMQHEAEELRDTSAHGPVLGTAQSEHTMMATAAAATEARGASQAASAAETAFEAAVSALERSIRTAGLRRGRENALVDEADNLAELSRSHAAAAEARGAATARAEAQTRAVAAARQAQHESEVRAAQAAAEATEVARREAEKRIQAANARCAEVVAACRAEAAAWRAETEDALRRELADEEQRIQRIADERVHAAEANFQTRTLEVRRGADARCDAAESQALEAQEACQAARANAEASRQEAQQFATSAAQASEWQKQLVASEEQCANLEQQRQADQARLVELEAQLAAAREKAERDQEAVQREIAGAQRDSANQRKAELAAVDTRVRKALASQQATIERLRRERDEAHARAETAEQLLGELEAGLTDTNHVPPLPPLSSSNPVAHGQGKGWSSGYPSNAHSNAGPHYNGGGSGGKHDDSYHRHFYSHESSSSGGAHESRLERNRDLHSVPEHHVPLPPPASALRQVHHHSPLPLPPSPSRHRERNAERHSVPLSPRRMQAQESPSIW